MCTMDMLLELVQCRNNRSREQQTNGHCISPPLCVVGGWKTYLVKRSVLADDLDQEFVHLAGVFVQAGCAADVLQL